MGVLPDVIDLAAGKRIGLARPRAAVVEHHVPEQTVQLGGHEAVVGGELLGLVEVLDGGPGSLEEEGLAQESLDGGGVREAVAQDVGVPAGLVGDAQARSAALGGGAREQSGGSVVDEAEVAVLA